MRSSKTQAPSSKEAPITKLQWRAGAAGRWTDPGAIGARTPTCARLAADRERRLGQRLPITSAHFVNLPKREPKDPRKTKFERFQSLSSLNLWAPVFGSCSQGVAYAPWRLSMHRSAGLRPAAATSARGRRGHSRISRRKLPLRPGGPRSTDRDAAAFGCGPTFPRPQRTADVSVRAPWWACQRLAGGVRFGIWNLELLWTLGFGILPPHDFSR